jgi:hypothetical protein
MNISMKEFAEQMYEPFEEDEEKRKKYRAELQ